MNAREMFKSLGYKRHESENGIQYFSESGVEITFIFLIRRFYKQENFKSLNISVDEFKAIQQQMKELGWIAKEEKQETNYEHYKDEIIEVSGYCFALVDGKPCQCSCDSCNDCGFSTGHGCSEKVKEWLRKPYEKPTNQLTQFEYDLLNAYKNSGMRQCISNYSTLLEMYGKGHFKGIDTRAPIHEILDNYEVIE
jgi:hypothetical protein